MKLWSMIHKCYVETVGIISGCEILCITEDGRWVYGRPDNLVKDKPKKNVAQGMHITVGHVIDNPTFDTCFDYRIVSREPDGDWCELYDSRTDENSVPTFLLTENVTYITLGDNTLILEVNV